MPQTTEIITNVSIFFVLSPLPTHFALAPPLSSADSNMSELVNAPTFDSYILRSTGLNIAKCVLCCFTVDKKNYYILGSLVAVSKSKSFWIFLGSHLHSHLAKHAGSATKRFE